MLGALGAGGIPRERGVTGAPIGTGAGAGGGGAVTRGGAPGAGRGGGGAPPRGRGQPPGRLAEGLTKADEGVAGALAMGAIVVIKDAVEATVDGLRALIESARRARRSPGGPAPA